MCGDVAPVHRNHSHHATPSALPCMHSERSRRQHVGMRNGGFPASMLNALRVKIPAVLLAEWPFAQTWIDVARGW
jgi:hypothetical protein